MRSIKTSKRNHQNRRSLPSSARSFFITARSSPPSAFCSDRAWASPPGTPRRRGDNRRSASSSHCWSTKYCGTSSTVVAVNRSSTVWRPWFGWVGNARRVSFETCSWRQVPWLEMFLHNKSIESHLWKTFTLVASDSRKKTVRLLLCIYTFTIPYTLQWDFPFSWNGSSKTPGVKIARHQFDRAAWRVACGRAHWYRGAVRG